MRLNRPGDSFEGIQAAIFHYIIPQRQSFKRLLFGLANPKNGS